MRRTESRVIGGRVIQLPMVDVHTVGAGGGSVAWRDDGGALRVGPRSAGAEPGPACYGRGGTEPTVTDANLLLGYLAAGLGARRRRPAGRRRSDEGRRVGSRRRWAWTRPPRPRGSSAWPTRRWFAPCASSTVERGVDPREFALMPFGGAGPMHAAAIASELDMRRILCPRAGGVLSALGLLASERRRDTARTVMLRGAELTADRIAEEVEALRGRSRRRWARRRPRRPTSSATAARRSSCRSPLPRVPTRRRSRSSSPPSTSARYGYRDPDAEVELVDDPRRARREGPDGDPRRGRGRHLGKHPARPLRRRVGAGASAAGGAAARASRPRDRASSSSRRQPWSSRRVDAEVDRHGTVVANRGRMSGLIRSHSRSWSAPCAPPARRWARCWSDPRTRRTSRSAATARRRCSTTGASWSCRPSTSPCTWGPCPTRSPPSPAWSSGRASTGSSTIHTGAGPTSPTSR